MVLPIYIALASADLTTVDFPWSEHLFVTSDKISPFQRVLSVIYFQFQRATKKLPKVAKPLTKASRYISMVV